MKPMPPVIAYRAVAACALGAVLCGCADVSMAPYRRPDAPAKTAFSTKDAASPSFSMSISV